MEENKGRKEKIYEGVYKMAGAIQDDKDKKNEGGNAFWESQGFTLREDLNYRNKALVEMIRIDPDYMNG